MSSKGGVGIFYYRDTASVPDITGSRWPCQCVVFAAQVELLVQSRNVRERLDGEEPLQDIPERPSQEALLSQQENMLQEVQASQTRTQDQLPQPEKVAALAASSSQHNSAGFGGNAQNCCSCVAPGLPTGHRDVGKNDMESSLVTAVNQGPTGVLPTEITYIEQRQPLSQTVQPSETPRQEEPALHVAPDVQGSAAVSVQENEREPVMVDAAAAAGAAASCLGKGASGVLVIDDSDDLDFELAQQMEDAARAAKATQHAQQPVHAQHDADSPPNGGSSSAPVQTDRPLTQAVGEPAVQTATHTSGTANLQLGTAGNAQAAAAVGSQEGIAQPSMPISSNAFQDNDMVIDDDLAQLLDAATALRPAGPPDSALAGPGPASTSASQCNSRKSSPHPRPSSAGSGPRLSASRSASPTLLHQAPHLHDSNPPEQADTAPGVPDSANQAVPPGGSQSPSITAAAREADGDMLALEPAGPADLVDHQVQRHTHAAVVLYFGPCFVRSELTLKVWQSSRDAWQDCMPACSRWSYMRSTAGITFTQ